MALIPAEPDHVFLNRRGMAPGLHYRLGERRLFILPGVPLELKGIVAEELEPQFLSGRTAASVRELRFKYTAESRFYPLMRELEGTHPDVSVGSYPNSESKELVIRCVGDDPARVEDAITAIRRLAAAQGMVAVS